MKKAQVPFMHSSEALPQAFGEYMKTKMRPNGRTFTDMPFTNEKCGSISLERRVATMLHRKSGRGVERGNPRQFPTYGFPDEAENEADYTKIRSICVTPRFSATSKIADANALCSPMIPGVSGI